LRMIANGKWQVEFTTQLAGKGVMHVRK